MAEQKWFTSAQAAPLLGLKNAEAVRNWRLKGVKEGWLRLGIHYKPRTPGKKPQLLYNIEKCQQLFAKKSA